MALSKIVRDSLNTGIDDNSDATAITIDDGENVMIGTTDTVPSNNGASGDAGVAISPDGVLRAARSGNVSLDINRMDSDGDIAAFRANGSTVGSVKVASSRIALYCSTANSGGIRFSTSGASQPVAVPTDNTGADSDATQDLGLSSVRWKDLYLSGGVYLGGTGSANHLDDYEEGTWTPAIYYQNSDDQTNSNNDTQTGFYVKVGTAVTAVCYLKWDATNSRANDNIGISGLPFAGSNVSGQAEVRYNTAIAYSGTSYPQGDSQVFAVLNPNTTTVTFITANGSANLGDEFGQNNNMEVRFTLQYVTA